MVEALICLFDTLFSCQGICIELKAEREPAYPPLGSVQKNAAVAQGSGSVSNYNNIVLF
jgi:hypothetical protein